MEWIVFIVIGFMAVVMFLGLLTVIAYVFWFSITSRHREFILEKLEEKEKSPQEGG